MEKEKEQKEPPKFFTETGRTLWSIEAAINREFPVTREDYVYREVCREVEVIRNRPSLTDILRVTPTRRKVLRPWVWKFRDSLREDLNRAIKLRRIYSHDHLVEVADTFRSEGSRQVRVVLVDCDQASQFITKWIAEKKELAAAKEWSDLCLGVLDTEAKKRLEETEKREGEKVRLFLTKRRFSVACCGRYSWISYRSLGLIDKSKNEPDKAFNCFVTLIGAGVIYASKKPKEYDLQRKYIGILNDTLGEFFKILGNAIYAVKSGKKITEWRTRFKTDDVARTLRAEELERRNCETDDLDELRQDQRLDNPGNDGAEDLQLDSSGGSKAKPRFESVGIHTRNRPPTGEGYESKKRGRAR